jgi:hypothetical protein
MLHPDDTPLPDFCPSWQPPAVLGTAALTTAAMHGVPLGAVAGLIDRMNPDPAARLYDTGILRQLSQQRGNGLALLDAALSGAQVFRVRRQPDGPAPLRVLALAAPGDLMLNTPLDFITSHLDVQLDVLYLVPGRPLPAIIPDHDVMFVAISEAEPPDLARIRALCARWPRPVLNEPAALPALARDVLCRLLDGAPGVHAPMTVRASRPALHRVIERPAAMTTLLPGAAYPLLLRPVGSHAGVGLKRLENHAGLAAAVAGSDATEFYLSRFIDYRSTDRLFRKYRIVFIAGRPLLCHMAVSAHWMVHYLNAGMASCAEKRQDEAAAMAGFERGFAARHARAFAAIHQVLPFDVFSIDCAELPDGRLLLFEADTAAIIHAMDPVDLFPYKQVQMRRVFDAFGALLQDRAAQEASR